MWSVPTLLRFRNIAAAALEQGLHVDCEPVHASHQPAVKRRRQGYLQGFFQRAAYLNDPANAVFQEIDVLELGYQLCFAAHRAMTRHQDPEIRFHKELHLLAQQVQVAGAQIRLVIEESNIADVGDPGLRQQDGGVLFRVSSTQRAQLDRPRASLEGECVFKGLLR